MNKKVIFFLITAVSLFATSANGAPMAYSVNSDGQDQATFDSLYLIDLSTSGSEELVEPLSTGGDDVFIDTEGLAFSPDGVLWGADDQARILFPINTGNAVVNPLKFIYLNFLPQPSIELGGNDFGMTFTCDSSIYLTSVRTNMLYRVDLEGNHEVIGNLGANISAIAIIGHHPARLYGLGNGLDRSNQTDAPFLYSIDTESGVATPIGTGLGNVAPYHEAGLAFDADGTLWAITDRSGLGGQPSQILSIDINSGEATVVSTTNETGFESLAIGPPVDCYEAIPTFSPTGLGTVIASLMLAGLIILRRRVF